MLATIGTIASALFLTAVCALGLNDAWRDRDRLTFAMWMFFVAMMLAFISGVAAVRLLGWAAMTPPTLLLTTVVFALVNLAGKLAMRKGVR